MLGRLWFGRIADCADHVTGQRYRAAWRRRSVLKMAIAPTEACAPRPDGWLNERHAHLHWKNREHMPCLGFDAIYSNPPYRTVSRHGCPGYGQWSAKFDAINIALR